MAEWREHPLVFECAGERLVSILHETDHPHARLGVLIVVGGPQYRAGSHRQFVTMARHLARAGFPVLRFDYRGMGDSEGMPRNFDSVFEDIRAALDAFLQHAPQAEGVVLWGLCDAASACLMYAHADARVHGIVIANPWIHTEAGEATAYLKHYYGQRLLQRSFWTKVLKGEFELRESVRDLLRKIARATGVTKEVPAPQSFIERMRVGWERFERPVLLLMSDIDLTAQEFRGLYESDARWARLVRRRNVRVEHLAGADHTFSTREALDRATRLCISWLNASGGVAARSTNRAVR